MIGFLAGATSPAGRWLVVGLVLLCLVTWARAERAGRHAAIERAVEAEAAVAGRNSAIEQLNKRIADLAEMAEQRANLTRRIYAQPRTTACVASPAVRALLDGLRGGAAGGAAGDAANLPGRAAPTRAGG